MRIPRERIPMSATAFVEQARSWAKLLEDREAKRTGEPLHRAREAVARQILIPPGTLENLRKNRLKGIAAHWYDNLRGGVIRALEAELRHVEFELQIARQTGLDPGSSDYLSALASQSRLREALNLGPSPNGEERNG